ncbi:hypothetical protein MIMGU_mgv1a018102mg, partial [Erythranthe guttata]
MAIDRNVRSIDLYFVDNRMLPGRILICQTLVDLILENCGSVPNLGSVVYLPCLKKLHLMRVGFEADESLWNLISGCPVLEDLLIKLYVDFRSCKVSSPTVKKARGRSSDNVTILTKQEVTTPWRYFVYLQLFHESAHRIETGPLTFLIEAYICIYNCIGSPEYSHYSIFFRSVAELISGLHNVKCLKLDSSCITKCR